ncbi:MAG: ABC transporter permease [Acidimicrobiales bacterium]
MTLALREMLRRPTRFAVATGVLTLIVVLVAFLGGLLDGLYLGSTGAISAQRADAFVFSATSRDSFLRSRIEPDVRTSVEGADGVESVAGLSIALLTATVPKESEPADVALIGYEQRATGIGAPPPSGSAFADRRLENSGVEVGQTLLIGRARTPVRVAGWVEDSNYLLQGGLWMNETTWRTAVAASRPDLRVADGVVQVLLVSGSGSPASLANRIDAATSSATHTLTRDEAILSIPGTKEQKATFLQIIYTTLAVAALVIGLFFSLLTIERTGLYGVLKALGSSTAQLFAGVVAQAVIVTAIALAVGAGLTFALVAIAPPSIPIELTLARSLFVVIGMLLASIAGSAISLRRVVRIDPASAIGTTS